MKYQMFGAVPSFSFRTRITISLIGAIVVPLLVFSLLYFRVTFQVQSFQGTKGDFLRTIGVPPRPPAVSEFLALLNVATAIVVAGTGLAYISLMAPLPDRLRHHRNQSFPERRIGTAVALWFIWIIISVVTWSVYIDDVIDNEQHALFFGFLSDTWGSVRGAAVAIIVVSVIALIPISVDGRAPITIGLANVSSSIHGWVFFACCAGVVTPLIAWLLMFWNVSTAQAALSDVVADGELNDSILRQSVIQIRGSLPTFIILLTGGAVAGITAAYIAFLAGPIRISRLTGNLRPAKIALVIAIAYGVCFPISSAIWEIWMREVLVGVLWSEMYASVFVTNMVTSVAAVVASVALAVIAKREICSGESVDKKKAASR